MLLAIIAAIAIAVVLVSLGIVEIQKRKKLEDFAKEAWEVLDQINKSRDSLAGNPGLLEEEVVRLQKVVPVLAEYTPESIVKFARTKYVGRHLRAYEANLRNLNDLFTHTKDHHHEGTLKKYKRS